MSTTQGNRKPRPRFTRLRAAVALLATGVLVATAGVMALGTGHPASAQGEKVVVCKYVGTPVERETAHHVIIVAPSTLKDFTGTFPYVFADAQEGSVAIRYATEGEQANDVDLSECPTAPFNVTAVPYTVTAPTCAADGTLVPADQPDHVYASQDPEGTGPGTYTITFTTDEGWYLTNPDPQVVTVEPMLTGPACQESVTAVPYTVTAPTCEADGTLVPADQPDHVYASQDPEGTGPGTYTITFTTDEGWYLTNPDPQVITVEPMLTGPECEESESPSPSPSPSDGDGNGDGNGDHGSPSVEPSESVRPSESVQPEETVQPSETVKGTETVKPQATATRTPIVLGTQATGVPTAVHAGLAGPTSGGPNPLGLALLGSGLGLILAAGWLALGRRAPGEHQV